MQHLAAFFALFLVSTSAFAADPAATHWYTVAVMGVGKEQSFTGSSSLDPSEIALMINHPADTIALENLREVFAGGADNLPFGWHPDTSKSKVYVPSRNVAYVVELPGDPAVKKP